MILGSGKLFGMASPIVALFDKDICSLSGSHWAMPITASRPQKMALVVDRNMFALVRGRDEAKMVRTGKGPCSDKYLINGML